MKLNEKVLISILILLIFTTIPIYSNAILQANGDSIKTNPIDTWIIEIRRMEQAGGTLGLSDTINTSNLTSSADSSNNLDIHMEKNTEFGAMAILSASAYGNQSKINTGETTTGNKSGIYININKEWVAAGAGLYSTSYAKSANRKYIHHDYASATHPGDAMEVGSWHGSGAASRPDNDSTGGLLRSYSGSIFSYYGLANYVQYGRTYYRDATYNNSYASRAVIVVGEGF